MPSIDLECITDSFLFLSNEERKASALAMREQLGSQVTDDLLLTSEQGIPKLDATESLAWKDWKGPRYMLKSRLGQAFNASTAWQCIAACEAIQSARHGSATVSVVGSNQQSIAARFVAQS